MCGFWLVTHSVRWPDALVVAGDRRAAFHGGRRQPLLHDPLRDLDLGLVERLLRVAAGHDPGERDVVGHLGVHLGRAGLSHLLRVDAAP